MKRTLIIVIFLWFTTATCAQALVSSPLASAPSMTSTGAAHSDPFLAAIESMKHSVAPIVCLEGKGEEMKITAAQGTAVFTSSSGEFLTAAHVVGTLNEDKAVCPMAALLFPDEAWQSKADIEVLQWFPFLASDCAVNAEIDVAKCHVTEDVSQQGGRPWIRPVKFEFSSQPDGMQVAFTGFPLNARDPLTSRTGIAGYRSGLDGSRAVSELILDHVAWHGGSGSPVYLSDGKVIGLILARGIEQATGIAIARPAESFRGMLPGAYRK